MIYSDELNQLNSQINDLTKKTNELEDTLIKEELSKNRFRHIDYGNTKYWVKILNIDSNTSDCVMVCLIDNYWQLRRHSESNIWLGYTDVITEEEFMSKFNDIYQLIKC